MDFSTSQDALIALAGTIFGGAGLEILRKILTKSKDREDSATNIRNEIRGELTSLKAEMATVEKELDMWRQKYYELFEKYILIKVQYDSVLKQLAANKILQENIELPPTPLDKTDDAAVDSAQQSTSSKAVDSTPGDAVESAT